MNRLHFNSQLLHDELLSRGIKVAVIGDTGIIYAEYKGHREFIDDTDLSVMPASLRYALDDKWKTKQLLSAENFSVIPGERFAPEKVDEAFVYAQKIGFPVVVKPISSTHGYAIRMNVGPTEFKTVFTDLARLHHFGVPLLVESQVAGNEFRLTVTRNDFFAAVSRIPPKVKGDGESTIKQLVQAVNESRKDGAQGCLCRICLDPEAKRYLALKNLTPQSVPPLGAEVFVRSNSNVSTGADCLDVTDLVEPRFKALAFDILQSLPSLPYVGIDLITRDITRWDDYFICELNPAPGLSLHTHPGKGQSRNLPAALVDLIFPETMN